MTEFYTMLFEEDNMETEIENMEIHTETVDTKVNGTFMKANLPVTLKFEEVAHRIKIKKGGGLFRRKTKSEERLILKGITGIVLPGELLAILGPSGSGKTTLVSALGGRLSGLTGGSITYNGKPFSLQMKRNTGFVAQNDVFYPYLSVIETLVFTALLQLPNCLPKEDKVSHVEDVIDLLRLTKCKNTVIGGRFLRGVSGGERKRVSIGQVLLMNPSLLFLDEPTTGLDSTVAKQIIRTLWELAKGGRTVVMTIHQPSSKLFSMFHKVLLLSEGGSLYFGKGECVMEYFSSMGYAPLIDMNPSDFLLDLSNGISSGDSQENRAAVKKALVSAYESNLAHKLKTELQDSSNDFYSPSKDKKFRMSWSTTWWQQFCVLLRRGMKERRHESFSALKVGRILVVAIFAGFLWWQSGPANIQDRAGLLFFYTQFWGMVPLLQAISNVPHERRMLIKERSSGMYRLSSYFLARTVADLPMEFTLPTLFVTITYWMGGLKATAINFFYTLSIVLFNALVAQGLGLVIGAVVVNQKSATTLGSVIMLTFLLLGGYFVQNLPTFISWIKYGSLSLYCNKLLLGSQYNADDTYPCASNLTCLVREFPTVEYVGLDKHGLSVAALAIMLVGYRLIAYFVLMKVGVIHK